MFLGVFRFTKNMNLDFQGLPRGHIYCMRGSSLVELTGDDNSATSTVAVTRMSSKECEWPSHIYSRVWINRVRLSILLVVS